MSKHTPGPWNFWKEERGGCEDDPTFNIQSDGGELLAQIDIGWIAPGGAASEPEKTDIHKANAYLIAAAPDLLEALKETDKHLNYIWVQYGLESTKEVQTIIRAAIAKAQGDSK